MSFSIRTRTILVLNLFVIGLAVVLGYFAQEVATQVVQERLAKEMAVGVSGLLKDKGLPVNDTMMAYLRQMFKADWVASQDSVAHVVGSSLPPSLTEEFKRQATGAGEGGVLNLGGQSYRMDWADVTAPAAGGAASYRLYMLVPYAQFQEARDRTSRRILAAMLPSAVVATAMAIVLAFTITRPLRKLAGEMDRLATAQHDLDPAGPTGPPPKAPLEIARLASSFYRLLDRLKAARDRLALSERLATLGKVSLSVAHELRNPLSGIKMHAQILRDRAKDPADQAGVEIILREIERMDLYLDELMSLSTGNEAPEKNIHRTPVKLSELAQSVLTILAGRCRHSKIVVQKNFPEPEPAVPADPGQLRQVLMNLMINAIEAMPTGGTMTLGLLPRDAWLVFGVADTGKGVVDDDRDIFEAFVSGKPNGVGLGLYLCRQIVVRHGGRIGYDSAPAGATFWFELPLESPLTPGDAEGI